MPWLKRNLVLVIGGLVAVGLLGLAGFFLFTKIQLNDGVTNQLNEKTEELKRLVGRDPHPGTEKVNNIKAAKEEEKKLQAFLAQVQQYFVPQRTETNQMTSREFRELLDNTIDELQRGAERSGVKVPEDYWYTFSAQKTSMTFATNIVDSLASQLTDIRTLCQILFDSKVISLVGLRRMPVATEDSGSQDYLTEKGITNNWTVAIPYELSFQAFSSELATVLEGIIRSKNCFVVKNLSVDRADAHQQVEETSTSSGNPYGPSSGFLQGMQRRYGLMPGGGRMGGGQGMSREMQQRYGMAPAAPQPSQPTPAGRPVGKGGNTVFLEEKALRMTLSVFAVKLKPAGKTAKVAEPAAPTEPAPPAQ